MHGKAGILEYLHCRLDCRLAAWSVNQRNQCLTCKAVALVALLATTKMKNMQLQLFCSNTTSNGAKMTQARTYDNVHPCNYHGNGKITLASGIPEGKPQSKSKFMIQVLNFCIIL